MRLVLECDVPAVSFLAALDVFSHLLYVEPQCLNLLHLNQFDLLIIQAHMPQPFNTQPNIMTLIFIMSFIAFTSSLTEPTYTIHYVRSYRRDLIDGYFGCGKSVIYGTYLYPIGLVDALFALSNSHIYGFNANCQRKDTYLKIFGEAQDYELVVKSGIQLADNIASAIGRTGSKKLVINWDYLPQADKREEARKTLEGLVSGLKSKGFEVFVKAPASYFCLNVAGKKYLLDLPAENFIVELYGEEAGKYTTYDSIFGNAKPATLQEGYTAECPKYPTRGQLAASSKKIYFQKTLDSSLPGFIGSDWEKYLEQAGGDNPLHFYDGYPLQTVDL